MIYNFFGKPHLPTLLRDCLLITQNKVPIPIGKVYLFTSVRSMLVRKFGELCASDIILDEKKFIGYFNCTFNPNIDILSNSDEDCTIQSSSNYSMVYTLNNVCFSKVSSLFGEDASTQYIKFGCLSYDIMYQNRETK
jgi:hypothetical protein